MEAARKAVGGSEYGTRKPPAGRGVAQSPVAGQRCLSEEPSWLWTGLVSHGRFAAPAGRVAAGALSRRVARQVPGTAVRRAHGPPVREAPGPAVRKRPGGLPGQLPGGHGRQPEPGEPAQVSRAGERCGPAPAVQPRRAGQHRLRPGQPAGPCWCMPGMADAADGAHDPRRRENLAPLHGARSGEQDWSAP